MTGSLNESDSNLPSSRSSDLFDEFEFKPITSGLGFQNQKKKAQSESPLSPKINLPFQGALGGLELEGEITPETTRNTTSDFERSASAEKVHAKANPSSSPSKVAEILGTLKQQRQLQAQAEPVKKKKTENSLYKESSPDFSALILDSMLVIALALTCLILLILVTEADLVQIALASSQSLILLSAGALLAMISWSYLILTRMYLGHTPGEWVFDQRLFLPSEASKLSSRAKLVWRTSLVVGTGWIALTFLSFVFRRDFAGMMSGAKLYRKLY